MSSEGESCLSSETEREGERKTLCYYSSHMIHYTHTHTLIR